MAWLREAVSKKKRRYRQDGFDLDLTCTKNSHKLKKWWFQKGFRGRGSKQSEASAPLVLPLLLLAGPCPFLEMKYFLIHMRSYRRRKLLGMLWTVPSVHPTIPYLVLLLLSLFDFLIVFSLDITDRVIAMGFPASGNEKYYRNPIDEIVKYRPFAFSHPSPCVAPVSFILFQLLDFNYLL